MNVYGSDWTMHSSPEPAHPSYRLMMALRLCAIASNHNDLSPEYNEDIRKWKEVLYGQAETISEVNERLWRATLLHICETIIERAREGIRKCSTLDLSEFQEPPSWITFQAHNIGNLWREELEVAAAVARSLRDGEIF